MPGIYVFDTNSFCVIANYYPESFPTFWEQVDKLVAGARLVSVREVYKELAAVNSSEHMAGWIEDNESIFAIPSAAEMQRVTEIFAVPHFNQLISSKATLRGSPVADPWLVAKAMDSGACVVTEEKLKPNAAKIPNVCAHFSVDCLNVQGMLQREGWRY